MYSHTQTEYMYDLNEKYVKMLMKLSFQMGNANAEIRNLHDMAIKNVSDEDVKKQDEINEQVYSIREWLDIEKE